MPRWIKITERSHDRKRCQGKFAENGIHFYKFKEPCGYSGSEETVSSVTFVTCEILVPFKGKGETIST